MYSQLDQPDEFASLFCPALTPDQEVMWGVWTADEETLALPADRTQRVRGADERLNSTAFDPDSKCVFKWAETTTAAATCSCESLLCSMRCSLELAGEIMPSFGIGCGASIGGGSDSSSYGGSGSGSYHHVVDVHQQFVQHFSYSSISPAQASPDLFDAQIAEFLTAENIDEFDREINTNYQQHPLPLEPIPFLDDIIASVKSELHQKPVASPSSSDAASPLMSPVPTVTLTPEQPITFVGEDGKEYRVVLQPVDEEAKKAPKRKLSSSSCEIKPKRAPGISLATLSEEEIAERKKEQNRAAAQRYREKMKQTKEAENEEKKVLTTRNAFLRDEAARLEKEIASLRSFIFNKVSA